jgi:hypothetical protein
MSALAISSSPIDHRVTRVLIAPDLMIPFRIIE